MTQAHVDPISLDLPKILYLADEDEALRSGALHDKSLSPRSSSVRAGVASSVHVSLVTAMLDVSGPTAS